MLSSLISSVSSSRYSMHQSYSRVQLSWTPRKMGDKLVQRKDPRQPSKTKRRMIANYKWNCGEWNFRITWRITEFPIHVTIENTELRKHTMILIVKVSLVWSKCMSKKTQVWLDVFMVSLLPAVLWNLFRLRYQKRYVKDNVLNALHVRVKYAAQFKLCAPLLWLKWSLWK